MEKLVINGGNRLLGRVKISGAKNAVLPIIAATLLGQEKPSCLDEVPALDDVQTIAEVLRELGVAASYDEAEHRFTVDSSNIVKWEAPYDLVRKMRASFLIMGPLLARCGRAKISLPGGCAIGTRPIDLHLKGFEALGADIEIGHGFIDANAPHGLKGARIYLDFPSVGATENILMAASMAEGQTILENPAQEPEIIDLANFLNVMGAKIRGAGTNVIKIEDTPKLRGASYAVIPDRIEAGTFVIMAAACADEMRINNVIPKHIEALTSKLQEMGADLEIGIDWILVRHSDRMHAADVTTKPYPGFATDLQQPLTALLTQVEGISEVTDTIYTERFKHCLELQRMGANIELYNGKCVVKGPSKLYGDRVTATDLRCGAALVIAGLLAEGETEIHDVYHIDRGYDNIDGKLRALGGVIRREKVEETLA